MHAYPIMLDVRGRLAVVVGGGPVGLRKAASLREAGARVRLVAPRTDDGADLAGLEVVRESYCEGLLEGAMLVLACTDDRDINGRVARDARRRGALVNVADTPDECDFHLPATVRDGSVVVAIGSGGAAPAVAAWLRDRLARQLPPRLGEFVALLEELRAEMKAGVADPSRRMAAMKRLVTDETYDAFLAGGSEAVRAKLRGLRDGY